MIRGQARDEHEREKKKKKSGGKVEARWSAQMCLSHFPPRVCSAAIDCSVQYSCLDTRCDSPLAWLAIINATNRSFVIIVIGDDAGRVRAAMLPGCVSWEQGFRGCCR